MTCVSCRSVSQELTLVPISLNLSSSVHRVTNLAHECVLELLKLSSNVNECKPLPSAPPPCPCR